MAITSNDAISAILKTWYKDGVENLLFRNSPVLKKIDKTRVEGKEQAFAAVYSRGGAVAPDFLVAKTKAAENVKNAEFKVTPGQLFSVFNYNAKEVQASVSKRGAYMKVAANKMFAATEAFRKTLAASLYGRGYGEIGYVTLSASLVQGTPVDITLTEDAIIKIDVGSVIAIKATTSGAEVARLEVNSIDEVSGTVNVTPATSVTITSDTDYVVALAGSMDASGNGIMPMGLDGWLPIVNGRSGATWTSFIGTTWNNVNRAVAADRLAGQFYAETNANAKMSDSVTALLRKVRRAGGVPNMIIMNDKDWYKLAKEIETTNTLFSQTSEKGKKKATMGFSDFAAAFSTNWIDNVYDDPYCPEGKFYILDSSAVEYFAYTNADDVRDGVADNEPGKQDPMEFDNKAPGADAAYKLLIDDILTVEPGEATSDGPAVRATLNFFGSLAVTNPSVTGVGMFYTATPEKVLGYLA